MHKLYDKSDSTSKSHDTGPPSRSRRPLLVWLAVMGFAIGTSICAFDPLNLDMDGQKDNLLAEKERKTMDGAINISERGATARPLEMTIPNGFQTATFSLG